MKQVFVIIIMLCCFNLLKAQPTPPELQRKIAGKRNLKAIMLEVERFYEKEEEQREKETKKNAGIKTPDDKNEEEFENGLLHWKRWEYFNQTRLKPNGDLEDVNAKTIAAWEKVAAKYDSATARVESGSNAAWNFIGPFNLQYQGGLYRGTSKTDRIVFHPTDPNTIYVCSVNGGLWRTQNGGSTWANMNFYFPIQSAAGLAINPANPANMWVITGDPKGGNGIQQNSCGIWVTYDGGGNWIKTSFISDTQSPIYSGYKIVIMPQLTYIMFAATRSGLYRSTNSGSTWNLVLGGTIYDVEFDPAQPGRVYASGNGTFYLSENYGSSFPSGDQTNIPGATRIEIGVSPANPDYVYLLCGPYTGAVPVNPPTNPPTFTFTGTSRFGGVYRSATGGTANSFALRRNMPNILCDATNGIVTAGDAGDQSGYDLAIDVHKANAEIITVAGKIVWTSTNGGMTLTNLTLYNEGNANATPPANYIHPDIQDIAYNPLNNLLYACTDGGVYVSGNGGTVWSNITNGIHATTFFHMAAAPFDVNRVLAGAQDNGVKYKSNSGDFTHITGADGFDCAFGPSAASSIYTTVNSSFLKFDINGVAQAANTPANTSFFPVIAADPVTNNTIYMASGGAGILKSTNGGANWTMVSGLSLKQSICACPNNANRIYVASNNTIIRTDNGGTNWTGNLAANPGFVNNGQITDINVCSGNSNYVYVTLGGYAAGQKVMYSNDAGANWFSISGTLPAEVKVNCVAIDQGNNSYIGTDMGVYYQAVYSSDWTPYFNELPRVPVTDLVINQGASRIRASTYGHGVWETGLYTVCDANFNLTGAIAGEKFYQASNSITSTISIVGGTNTRVVAKAGNEIILNPIGVNTGFTVFENSEFYGILGPCESGPVPILSGRAADVPLQLTSQADKGNDSTLYRYGFITISQPANKNATITINAIQDGNFSVIITDKNGDSKQMEIEERMAAKQTLVKPIPTAALAKGYYLVQLYYSGQLVHLQELIVK